MSKTGSVFVLGLLLVIGCQKESLEYMDCNQPHDLVQLDAGSIEVSDLCDNECYQPSGWVGRACVHDSDCDNGQCFTTEFVKSLGVDIENLELKNGMCSKLGCIDDKDCGAGGICFDTTPFTGLPIKICLKECSRLSDCRWQENYSCYATEQGRGVCLPDSIIVALEQAE